MSKRDLYTEVRNASRLSREMDEATFAYLQEKRISQDVWRYTLSRLQGGIATMNKIAIDANEKKPVLREILRPLRQKPSRRTINKKRTR